MFEGLYSCEFEGCDASGIAALVFERGLVTGSDGVVDYKGTYRKSCRLDELDVEVVLHIPAGVPLVTGAPARSEAYTFTVTCRIRARGTTDLVVAVPGGSVGARVRYIRDIPRTVRRGLYSSQGELHLP